MAMDLSNNMLVTNPTTYGLGKCVIIAGIAVVIIGVITQFRGPVILPGDIFLSAGAWYALGIPTTVIGGIFIASGLRRN
jgi:hypothetical protein